MSNNNDRNDGLPLAELMRRIRAGEISLDMDSPRARRLIEGIRLESGMPIEDMSRIGGIGAQEPKHRRSPMQSAELVEQNADASDDSLDHRDALETLAALNEAATEVDRGEGASIDEAEGRLREKLNIRPPLK